MSGQYVVVCGFNYERMWHPNEVRREVRDHGLTHCATSGGVFPILGLPLDGVRTTGNRVIDYSDILSFGQLWG